MPCPSAMSMTGRGSIFTVPSPATSWTPSGAAPRSPSASWTTDQVVPQAYTSYFRSVILFGTLRILEEDGDKRAAIERLALKYAPTDTPEGRQAAIEGEWGALCLLEMTVEHCSGKEAIELVQGQRAGEGKIITDRLQAAACSRFVCFYGAVVTASQQR